MRTSEALGATWDEIDLDACLWTIPANRMKAGKEHVVPLSDAAVELLKAMPRVGAYVFPGRGDRLSENALLVALQRMRPDVTVHGFRSAFRDWAGDKTSHECEVIEHALAHQLKNKTEAAYRRGSALDKRRKLMAVWAAFCAGTEISGNVERLRGAV